MILSPSSSITIRELANLIKEIIGFEGRILWDMDMPNGQLKKPSDNSDLISFMEDYNTRLDNGYLGFKEKGKQPLSFTPIREGLEKAIEWYLSNESTARRKIY
jgi:GDP-L-fucose synthase